MTFQLDDEEKHLALAGKKIEAIKHLKDRTGCGLKEAKDSVELFLSNPGEYHHTSLFFKHLEEKDTDIKELRKQVIALHGTIGRLQAELITSRARGQAYLDIIERNLLK